MPMKTKAEEPVKLWINGDYVNTDVSPVIENGRTLVPVRIISETLGFEVLWEQDEQKVIIFEAGNENENDTLTLAIGSQNAYRGVDEVISLDVAPKIVDGRTLVPIRFIAEQFGQKVDWDQENYTAIIGEGYKKEIEEPKEKIEITPVQTETASDNVIPKDNLTESPYPDRLIKGNINSKGEKIFHAPGQRDYKKTIIDESKGERWFKTESEAIEAGWRKAQR